MGLVYQDMGKDEAALAAFSEAIERAPENTALQINRRQLMLRVQGMSTLDRYAVLVTEYPEPTSAVASICKRTGRKRAVGRGTRCLSNGAEIRPKRPAGTP